MVLEVSNVPDSGDGEGRSGIQGKAAPVPGEFEWIQDIIEDADGDKRFV